MKKAVTFLLVGCFIAAGLVLTPASRPAEAAASLALISGTVNDDAGKPLAGAVVALFTAPGGSFLGGSLLKRMTTDAEGRFKANVVPGIYRLRAVADGFRPTFTLVDLDVANRITHNFSLRRAGTLIEQRGDKGDYRWIGRSVPRTVLHYQEEGDYEDSSRDKLAENSAPVGSTFHGIVQFTGLTGGENDFLGANFAVSTTFGREVEAAFVGQGGVGDAASQRLATFVSMRPSDRHQVNAAVGYGKAMVRDMSGLRSLEQFSFGVSDAWQVSKPLLLIFGFDYATFGAMGKGDDSILPRFAVQFTPDARNHFSAALTPGTSDLRQTAEGISTENIQARFETRPAEIALSRRGGIPDRSRRLEIGYERLLGENGNSSVEASAFYDMISGHGIGVLALPLEASPETQNTFQQVARQVVAMNGAARGVRLMYARRVNDYITASVGYSVGHGQRMSGASLEEVSPVRMFTGSNFQVASAKLDLDFSAKTGTRVSTVVRLSPSAVVFAIDPFAGRMSVYDPNVSVYVTQSLPSFGLPGKFQALVDVRNLLDQSDRIITDKAQLLMARSQRSVRGAISFQW